MVERTQRKPDLISLEQAAWILGCRPRTLRLRMLQEQLTRYRNPIDRRGVLLDRHEVEALLDFEVVAPRENAA